MADQPPVLARAISDGDDRLVMASEPLAGLQLRCGGALPGKIAIPSLLETVRKARRYELRLARMMTAQDDGAAVTAWVEVSPREDGEEGCEIVVQSWHGPQTSAAIASDNEGAGDQSAELADHRADEIDRSLAELTARLDAGQKVLAVEAETTDLIALADAMRAGIGRPWTDFVTIEGGNHALPMHWRLLDGAAVSFAGSERPWQVRLYPHVVPGTQPSGFDLCLTSVEPYEEAPVLSTIGSASAVPGMIGRDIAPVLRQPIARIIANAETIRTRLAGPLAEEYASYAADIAAAGQHLLGLLDDLSDLEVVEAEEFGTAPDRIDLGDVARRAAGILGVRAREHGIEIVAPQVGETMPAIAEFRRVLQVLLNLVGNAIRYSPPDSQVWLRLEDAGDRARVIVADQGPGLTTEQQSQVFEKFERLGRSNDGGSGLGLYISRRLARAMGGDVTVESAPGQGARFILEVPADLLSAKPVAH